MSLQKPNLIKNILTPTLYVCWLIYVWKFFNVDIFLVLIRSHPKIVFEHSVQYLRNYPSFFQSADQFLAHFFTPAKSGSSSGVLSENPTSEYVMFQFLAEACLENIGEALIDHLPLLFVNAVTLYGPNRMTPVTFVDIVYTFVVSGFSQVTQ